MSAAAEQERDAEHFEEPHPALWRISVVVTRSGCAAGAEKQVEDESQLWDAPPGYSLTSRASLAPAPITQVSPHRHTWSARLKLAAIAVATVALIILEASPIS